MENNLLNVTKEELEKMTVEEIVDLKVEVEDLIVRLDKIIADAEEALNA